MLIALAFAFTVAAAGTHGRPVDAAYRAASAGADPAAGTLRRLRALVKVDAHRTTSLSIEHILEEIRRIWRPYVDVDFTDAFDSATEYDDRLTLVVADRSRTTGPADVDALGWIDFRGAGHPVDTINGVAGRGQKGDERGALGQSVAPGIAS